MNRLLYSIDRWAPAAVSLLALFLVAGGLWVYSVRIARLEGQYAVQQDLLKIAMEDRERVRSEVAVMRNWAIAAYERAKAEGVQLPEPPPHSPAAPGSARPKKE